MPAGEAVPAAAAAAAAPAFAAVRQDASPPGVTGASARAASSSASAGVASGGGSTYTTTLASKLSSRPRQPCLHGQTLPCQLLILRALTCQGSDGTASRARNMHMNASPPGAVWLCSSGITAR